MISFEQIAIIVVVLLQLFTIYSVVTKNRKKLANKEKSCSTVIQMLISSLLDHLMKIYLNKQKDSLNIMGSSAMLLEQF